MVRDKKDYNKEYYEKHKEKYKEKYIDNGEKMREQHKQWRENNYNKTIISKWKKRGLIELEGVYTYESLLEYYFSITHCELCKIKFKDSIVKNMDHCHMTNIFRYVLCRKCNLHNPLDIHCNKNNTTTGHRNIYEEKHSFRFRKYVNKKKHSKLFKTLEEAIIYKEEFINNIICGLK